MTEADKAAKKVEEQMKGLETKYEGILAATKQAKPEEKKIEAAGADKSAGLLA